MKTRKRPGREIWVVILGPFVPIGSLVTCTSIRSPFLTCSWIGGYLRPLSRSSSSSSSPLGSRARSETCRNAAFPVPISTNAAWIPGRTPSTFPRLISPTSRSASGRSDINSTRVSSSSIATRVSSGVAEIIISRFIGFFPRRARSCHLVSGRAWYMCRSSPPGDISGDDHTLHLAGALPDLTDLGVAHHPFYWVFVGVTVSPHQLHGFGCHPHCQFRGI